MHGSSSNDYTNSFKGCSNIEKIYFTLGSGDVSTYSTTYTPLSYSKDKLKTVVLPEGLETIPGSMFKDSKLMNLNIPTSVTEIGYSAFSGCSLWKPGDITLPDTLTSIGASAFNSVGISRVLIPAGVTSIGTSAFTKNSSLVIYGEKDSAANAYATSNGHRFIRINYIELSDVPDVAKPGGEYQLSAAMVTGIDKNADQFTWSVEGGTSEKTTITDAGLLTVGEDETSDKITVKAEYVKYSTQAEILISDPCAEGDHVYGDLNPEHDAGCEEDGMKAHYTCSECGAFFDANKNETTEEALKIKAYGHDYKEIAGTAVPATCTTGGKEADTECSKCHDVQTGEPTPVNEDAHTVVVDPAVAPNCLESGLTEGSHCSECGSIIKAQEVAKAYGHDWSDWITDKKSTCQETGSRHRECSRCRLTETEGIDISSHEWNTEYTIDQQPTCTECGSKSIHCMNCTMTIDSQVVDPLGHDHHADRKTAIAATCTANGKEADQVCSRCGDTIAGSIVAATGHKWNTVYTADKNATYANAGSRSIHCSICGVIKPGSTETVPKLTVNGTVLKKPVAAKKAITVKWNKGTNITGYEIQYSLKSSFSGSKKATVSKAGTTSKKISKLKSKKKYYIRIRTFKTADGKKYYSAWSAKKSVKTK